MAEGETFTAEQISLDQAVRDIMTQLRQEMEQMVVSAVNRYAELREKGEGVRFRALMAEEYPILDQLGGNLPQDDNKPGSSEHPPVATLLGSGEHVCAGWTQYLPFGSGKKSGETLVWNKQDESWDVGIGLPEGEKDKQILIWHKYTADEKKELKTDDSGEWRVEDWFLPDGTIEGQVLRWHKYTQEEKEELQTDRPGEWQPGWVTAIESESQAGS